VGQNNEQNSEFALNVGGIDKENFMEQRGYTVAHQATEVGGNSSCQQMFEVKHERLLYIPPFDHRVYSRSSCRSHNEQQ
jgi:hypothetical protein